VAAIDFDPERVDSGLSLKTFWRDGGEIALASRLRWGRKNDRWLWQPPSMRTTLTRDSAPKHPLLALLCPAAAAACGKETEGWALRADQARRSQADAKRASFLDTDPVREPPKAYSCCKAEAAAALPERAFLAFADCMRQVQLRQDALPLGHFQAPTEGWLVLRGRRGHHGWCNELRAYDLATGTAHIASTCRGMFAAAQSAIKVETGTVPVPALQEAAWMIFLAPTADHDVLVAGEGRYIPDEITIRAPKTEGLGVGVYSIGTSSGRTTLLFQWVRGGKSVTTGTMEWPDADDAAEQHATELLEVAEAGFSAGCAPAALPPVPFRARLDKATRVGDPNAFFPEYEGGDFTSLEQALQDAGKRSRCSRQAARRSP
jgi:hypothetical protein